MPIASSKQFMELAVNIPEQEPHPGQGVILVIFNSSSLHFPTEYAPTASKTLFRSIGFKSVIDESIGPPETKMDGRLSLALAINIPGRFCHSLE